jgi:Spirocyclase AveC-like
MVIGGCAVMRATKLRFPKTNVLGLLIVAVSVGVIGEILLDGVLFAQLGFFSFPGGWLPLFYEGKFSQYPLNEALHTGLWFGVLFCMRYFTNDRGESLAERGASGLRGSSFRQIGTRGLAVIGMTTVSVFVCYHIPNAFYGANSPEWPADVTSRSYLTNQCGPQIDRACPGPSVPLPRPGSGYVNWHGDFVDGKSLRPSDGN